MYQVSITKAAERELKKLTPDVQRRVAAAIKKLTADPRPSGVEKLTDQGEDFYRVRVGDFRIIYQVHDKELVVLVVAVGDRKEIYRRFT